MALVARERVGAGVVGSVPFADCQQRLDPIRREDGDVDPVPAHRGKPLLADLGGLPWPSDHREHVGDRDVDPVESMRIADSLGALQCLVEEGEAIVGATEVGEAVAERRQGADLHVDGTDLTGERERLLAHRL